MKLLKYLLWPNMWIAIFSTAGLLGLVSIAVGLLIHVAWLRTFGIWLEAPLLTGGVVLVLVAIPILIYANWKRERKI